ncbi:MAG: NAD(P)H-dependent oxidoreductase [Steroidobacteraceae bacterium]
MPTLLQLKTSLFSNAGQSSLLADEFVDTWRKTHPEGRVITRDLAATPVPHLTAERFQAFLSKPEERTAEQQAVVDFSDALIAELRAVDEVVIGVPTYNFGIPSTLKAYFDHIARAGVTFRYTANGPVGLIDGKKVHIVAARGGFYAGTPTDSVTRYVADFLSFLGMSAVNFVYAEGLAISATQKEVSLQKAGREIATLLSGAALAEVA